MPRQRPATALQWLGVAGAMGLLVLVCVAPLAAILWHAASALFVGQGAAVLTDADTLAALGNTLRFSVLAVVFATALGLSHAFALQSSVTWRALAFLPFVVSPVSVAFGLLLLYPDWSASLPVLLAAYALLAWPFVTKSVTAALDGLPGVLHLVEGRRSDVDFLLAQAQPGQRLLGVLERREAGVGRAMAQPLGAVGCRGDAFAAA